MKQLNKPILFLVMTVALLIVNVSVVASTNESSCVNRRDSQESKNVVNLNLEMSANFYIKVAETILVEIYGNKVLKQRPWKISDCKDYIAIEGSLHIPKVKGVIVKGGTVRIVLSKHDCRIIELTHGK